MTPAAFHRVATVEFAIGDGAQRITIRDLPYLWIPAADGDMDQSAIYAARDWAREHLTGLYGLTAVSVSTSPAPNS